MIWSPRSLPALRMRTVVLLTLFGVSASVLVSALLTPTVVVDDVRQNTIELSHVLPVVSSTGYYPLEATLHVLRRPWQTQLLTIVPDDCIELLRLNGARITSKYCPKGALDSPRNIALPSNALLSVIEIKVRNGLQLPMGVSIFPDTSDWRSILPRAIAALFLMGLCIFVAWRTLGIKGTELYILGAGFMARALYSFSTPFGVRAYDSEAHLEYVKYLATHLHLPPASGWEFHQPPLYYWMASLVVRGGHLLGWSLPVSIPWIQLLSFTLSCAALLAGAWIGVQVLGMKRRTDLLLYLALTAGLPAFIMLSSRISNDVLVPLVVFIGAGLLLRWHREHRPSDWILLWILSGIGFLVKLNTLCLPLSVVIVGLLSRRGDRPTFRAWAGGFFLFLVLTAWLPIVRLHERPSDMQNLVLTGKAGITHLLGIRHEPEDYLTFNPVAMLRQPFNTPYSDIGRRANPLEYLFRSALFGEFRNLPVPWIAHEVLFLALLILPWMAYGALKTSLDPAQSDAPVTILFLATLVLWLAYITIFQFSPEQDFRFSPFFGIAGALLIIRGLQNKEGTILHGFGTWCGFVFATLATLMLVL